MTNDLRERVGKAALKGLMDRRGLREPLQEIKRDDPEVWSEIVAEAADAAITEISDQAQAELQAAVAAEREACALVCDEYSKDHGSGMFDRHSNECANRIRARTDPDAQAALKAVKREARNEALREAVHRVSAAPANGSDLIVRDWAVDVILALMEEQSDD